MTVPAKRRKAAQSSAPELESPLPTTSRVEVTDHFPFEEVFTEQRQAWDFIEGQAPQKKILALELPTGVGKSAIAIAATKGWSDLSQRDPEVRLKDGQWNKDDDNNSDDDDPTARIHEGSYILTTQRILQTQYMNDFGNPEIGCSTVWSKNAYECSSFPGHSCAVGMIHKRLHPERASSHACRQNCPYIRDLRRFNGGAISVTNTAYFLCQASYTDTIKKRQLLVVDECHNLEDALVGFVGVDIDRDFVRNELELDWPMENPKWGQATMDKIKKWIDKVYEPAWREFNERLEVEAKDAASSGHLESLKLYKKWTRLDNDLCALHRFQEGWDPNNWIVNVAPNKWELRPIDVAQWGKESLFQFADSLMLMSATILDPNVYARSIGLDPSEMAFMSLSSPFPVENRPIFYTPVGLMNMRFIENTLPKMAQAVQTIVDAYPNDKGIIHCHTYKIAQYIMNHIKCVDSKGRNRIRIHTSANRENVYKEHLDSPHPTVLLSPSMSEGVDLKGDRSRFQVICKIPFPYLGDQRIKIKFDRDPGWYNCITARTLVQQTGRSIRNREDWAHSYILDQDFESFVKRSGHLLPEWWLQAVKTGSLG